MKKLSIFLIAFSLIAFSCGKTDVTPEEEDELVAEGSISMTYEGKTYTEVKPNSLNMVNGVIAAIGIEGNEFSLLITGIGADGTTTNICLEDECTHNCTLMLDFSGAAEVIEGFIATSGTIKRTGKTLEISASGMALSQEMKTVSVTIVTGVILDF